MRICRKRGCRTHLSRYNHFDTCSLHTERHIMPSPGVYINMKDGLPPLPVNDKPKPRPLRYGQCPECKRIMGRRGCVHCDVTPAVLDPEVVEFQKWRETA